MEELPYSELRHHMLAAIADPGANEIFLTCVSRSKGLWKPRVRASGQFNLSAGQARAVNEILRQDLAHTPGWQGDMDVDRVVRLTQAGVQQLARWDEEHCQGEA